jgi:ABC-type transport system involved in cytochrome bd biosynthesis fused ATPase/permease subunit
MIETALLFVLSVLSGMFAVLFYMQKKKNVQIMAQTIEFLMMQEAQQQQIKTDKEQFNEDFLKFISDSRDWAYTYIEDVQESLNRFITDIEPEIMYFDEYSDLMAAEPNYNSMKKISGAYKELKKLLPEEYGKIDT